MDKEKLERKMAEVRETAVKVDRVLKEGKRRKKAAEAKAKEKTPPTEEPEEMYERVILKGKPLEKAILYLRNFDLNMMLGRGILTDGQKTRLRDSIKTRKDEAILAEVGRVYNGLWEYTRFYLNTARKLWEVGAMQLLTYCQKWETADQLANTLTEVYYSQILPLSERGEETADPHSEEAFTEYAEKVWPDLQIKQGINFKIEQTGTDEEGRPLFKIATDIDGEEGLYSKIIDSQDGAQTALNLFRGAVEPFSDFVFSNVPLQTGGTIFPYTTILPHMAEGILEYPDALSMTLEPEMDKYFAYRLRQRKEAGETITPEEEKRAVIPDYNQADNVESFFYAAKRRLNKILPEYYDLNYDYEREQPKAK